MLNGNVKLIEHNDNEEQVRQTECLREMMDKVIDINGFSYNEIQDMIDHVSTIWGFISHFILNNL